MDLKNINFRNYNRHNRNFFFENGIKLRFRNTHKVDIVLSLLQNLRNRSYHWENILKTTEKKWQTLSKINDKNRKHSYRIKSTKNRFILK